MTVVIHQNLLRILTLGEAQVTQLLISGHSNKEVARQLGISPRTVEVHRARAMEKASARNPMELALTALTGMPGTRDAALQQYVAAPARRDWLLVSKDVPTVTHSRPRPTAEDGRWPLRKHL